jgi:transcriptional regulator with XRE-family HTH domain
VRRWREERRLTLPGLSERLKAVGRPILPSGLSKIELGERRADVDDLVALAIALEVSPAALLMPNEPTGERVDLTENRRVSFNNAWSWATGEGPLLEPGEELELHDPRYQRFIRENRPHENPRRPMGHVARYLIARGLGGPFVAEVRHNGKTTKTRLAYGEVDWDGDDGGN